MYFYSNQKLTMGLVLDDVRKALEMNRKVQLQLTRPVPSYFG